MVNRLTSPKSVLTSVGSPAPEESALISSPRVTSYGRTFSIAEQATACAAERLSIITLVFQRVMGPNRAAVIIYEAVDFGNHPGQELRKLADRHNIPSELSIAQIGQVT